MNDGLGGVEDIVRVNSLNELMDCCKNTKVIRPETPVGNFEIWLGLYGKYFVTISRESGNKMVVNRMKFPDSQTEQRGIDAYMTSEYYPEDSGYETVLNIYNKEVFS